MRVMRVLILKLGAIGDVLMAVPAAQELHRLGHTVTWVANPAIAPVLRLYPWLHVLEADEQAILRGSFPEKARALAALWRQLLGQRYDQVFTLYYDARYRVLAGPVRAGRRVMLSAADRRFRLLPGRHHTDEYARILLGWPDEHREGHLAPVRIGGLPPSPLPPSGKARVVLTPAGARNLLRDDALRRWPAERYVELARLLLAEGMEVVLAGGPDDSWASPFFAGLGITDLIGRLSLVETLALFDGAQVLVTHDTGPLHLGGITGVGIVSVFGPTDPRGRLPQRPGALALWGGERMSCRPCYDGRDFAPCPANQCMSTVSPGLVAARVLDMVQARRTGVPRPPRVEVV